MGPPSQLSIATSSITRLLKEESSYRTELLAQQKRLEQLQTEAGADGAEEGEEGEEKGNEEFRLRQEVSITLY